MEFKPPQNLAVRSRNRKTVFLGGSIEMGKAKNWQKDATEFFNQLGGWDIFNPRRDDWDSSWEQSFDNPQFFQQVVWEHTALELADLIIICFEGGTMSPISLLELGLFAKTGKIRVVCPKEFWRKGNVDIVCSFYDIPLYVHIDTLLLDLGDAHEKGISTSR